MTLAGVKLFTSLAEVRVSLTGDQVRDLDFTSVTSGVQLIFRTGLSIPVITAFGGGNKSKDKTMKSWPKEGSMDVIWMAWDGVGVHVSPLPGPKTEWFPRAPSKL